VWGMGQDVGNGAGCGEWGRVWGMGQGVGRGAGMWGIGQGVGRGDKKGKGKERKRK